MNYLWEIHAIFAVGLFVIGTVVGSFLNVVIYRVPWEKSVIWPPSRCPKCLHEIEARDNVPILGWMLLGGACRNCRTSISVRYPSIELLVGLLFAGVYYVDAVATQKYLSSDLALAATVFYHTILVSLLVAITFIDFDLMIVPGELTTPGIIAGILLGGAFPFARPVPMDGTTFGDGLKVGIAGAIVGAFIIWFVRVVGTALFRKEAMGSGDIHIMALIGAFMGWKAVICVFFLAPFLGLLPSMVKILIIVVKKLMGRAVKPADHEIPYGPYLSAAAVILLMTWPVFWQQFGRNYFETLPKLFWFVLGNDRVLLD